MRSEGWLETSRDSLRVIDVDGGGEVDNGIVSLSDGPCWLCAKRSCQCDGRENGRAKDELAEDGHCVKI